jgi:hypothetical protein
VKVATVAACAVGAALVLAPTAAALTPLKPADMRNIRADARDRARTFAHIYHARSWSATCTRTTPYSARCHARLYHVGAKASCTITSVYVVTRAHQIEGEIGRDTCD